MFFLIFLIYFYFVFNLFPVAYFIFTRTLFPTGEAYKLLDPNNDCPFTYLPRFILLLLLSLLRQLSGSVVTYDTIRN